MCVRGRVASTCKDERFDIFFKPLSKWFSISVYCPEKEYFAAIFEDISERKKAEEGLRESEQRWSTTLDSIGDGVIATDVFGKVTFMNKEAEKLTGWSLSESSNRLVKDVFNIINEQTRLEVENPIYRVLKEGLVVGLANHTVLIRKDKSEVPIDDSGAPIKTKEDKIMGVVLIFRDITERKKSEEDLKKQAELIALSPDAIIGKKLDDTITFWSQGAQNLYGWTKEEALGKKSRSLLRTKFPEPYEVIVKALFSEGRWSGEKIHQDKFGHEIIVDSRWLASCNKQNEIEEILETNVDITQRKKLEVETQRLLGTVKQERDRIQSLLNSMNDEVWFADLNKKFTLANPSALKEFKLDPSSQSVDVENLAVTSEVYRSDGSVRPVEEAPPLRALYGEIIKNQEEIVRTPIKGELRTRQVSSAPVRNANGTIIGSVSVVRDVTEIKNLEKQLQDYTKNLEKTVAQRTLLLRVSEEKYRTLFDSIDEGFCIVEMVFDADCRPLDYRFLEVNASFERQTGMHNAKGKLMRSFAPNHEAYWFEIYGKVALTGEPVRFTNEARELTRWYDVYAFPVGEGPIRKVGILFNDVSARMNLEKQLKDSERLAAIGATAGMVGHDIRNPLQAITGDIYLVKTELASISDCDEKKNAIESLTEIEKNVDYINKIVADLQDFARPLKPHAEEADLKLIINELLKKNGLPENVEVTVKIERDARKVVADSTFINRIMFNLVNNAVQAMPKGGKLTIHAFKDGKDVVIKVADTGVGIPESVKGKLFTPMFTTKSKGQGFGLAVIKRMTEALGGTVTFESQEGKGTTFIVRLSLTKN